MDTAPFMIALAGPNGAGKTSFYYNELHHEYGETPFLNADIIQYFELEEPDMKAAYRAAEIASERRQNCIDNKTSFIWESTFSHPSKPDVVAAAKAAGFYTKIIHIGVATPEICQARVALRVEEGGHNVPAHKVFERYSRCPPLIRRAIEIADEAQIFDNSVDFEEPKLCLSVKHGVFENIQPIPPDWIRDTYPTDLNINA
ncbi:zeta toxin family protein [Gilvimarinus sp. SDUM040013]|uniref:Zeta toxin family protein n=1 Tax=Gilvimarinus gilvus TaxID=3058038 RepID=A0ABU4RT53_9GAMM|nr:zeta toxin family protein [Gilvimarinus sp. SDUM040013]MDO3387038.1 zeta toxin family protein [Gilvimarinus sp. SDUM040013]MDX6848068.1 zeta toxin family protein [Gilvimarinus sp. SDUM040013]